mgnify:CR=1 FL=1
MDEKIKNILDRLSKSKFRSSFKLSNKDKKYIEEKGIDVIYNHAHDFVVNRLSSDNIPNDGKQTPMRGHPVFVAQHATGTCCRGCIYKWHKIPKNRKLTDEEIDYLVDVIMTYIVKNSWLTYNIIVLLY